jgi:hypothetical protein
MSSRRPSLRLVRVFDRLERRRRAARKAAAASAAQETEQPGDPELSDDNGSAKDQAQDGDK